MRPAICNPSSDGYATDANPRRQSARSPRRSFTAAYHMLRDGTFYQDLGASHFHRPSPEDQANRLARKIASLRFNCMLTPAAKRKSARSRRRLRPFE